MTCINLTYIDVQLGNKTLISHSLSSKSFPIHTINFQCLLSDVCPDFHFDFTPFLPNAERFLNSNTPFFSSQLFALLSLNRFRLCFVFPASVQQAFEDLAKSFVRNWLRSISVCLLSTWTTDSLFACNRRLLTCFFQVSFFFADWINRTHKISQLHNKFGSPYETHLHFC